MATITIGIDIGQNRDPTAGAIHLGKAWLVAHLQTLLQTDRLHLPPHPCPRPF